MSVEFNDISENDVLEASFYSEGVGQRVKVAVDVETAYFDEDEPDFKVIFGEVMLVKNMPFDALEGVRVKFELKDDVVYKNNRRGVRIGEEIELLSI